jgi:cytochrome b subunit of formate dehydrogenase
MARNRQWPATGPDGTRRIRHALVDRLFHWICAAAVLLLLGTSLLPILGFEFAWVRIHWWTGVVLAALVVAHMIRASFWQDFRSMWIGFGDLKHELLRPRSAFRGGISDSKIHGKYSLAQKAIHHIFSVVVLTAIGTGFLMLAKVDTPWWRRDPYWLSDDVWATVYVLHDLASLALVTMIIVHIYFALRPEKFYLTKSMIFGWITGTDYTKHYAATRRPAESER